MVRYIFLLSEPVARGCSVKKVFRKISQNSQENIFFHRTSLVAASIRSHSNILLRYSNISCFNGFWIHLCIVFLVLRLQPKGLHVTGNDLLCNFRIFAHYSKKCTFYTLQMYSSACKHLSWSFSKDIFVPRILRKLLSPSPKLRLFQDRIDLEIVRITFLFDMNQ